MRTISASSGQGVIQPFLTQFCIYLHTFAHIIMKEDCYPDGRGRGTALLLVRYQTVSFCMTSSRLRPVHANVPIFSFNAVYSHPSMPKKAVSRQLIRIAVVVENDVVHVALSAHVR
jgi:hypothetical protein